MKPGKTLLTFALGAAVATAAHLAFDAASAHDFTLPSAAGQVIRPGGPSRGEA